MSEKTKIRSARHGLIAFLALQRSVVGLLAMVILVGLGEKLAERFLPLYLVALGGGALSVGLLGGMDNFLSAIYSLVGGHLAERLGLKRSLLVFNLVAGCGFLLVVLIPSWPAVLAAAVLFLSWTAISLPATMGLVARVLPKHKRIMGVSMHSMTRRVPMALGPLVGGVLVDTLGVETGVRTAFAVALVFSLVAALLQHWLIEADPQEGERGSMPRTVRARLDDLSPALRRLLVADILVRFCEQIPYAFVVLWCTAVVDAPITATQFGALTAIEMVTALLIYVPVAHFADRSHKKPFVLVTFAIFSAFPLVLLFSQSFWPLAFAFVVRGLKELGEPTRKALIMELAPEDRKAGTFGLYYLIRDLVVSLAAFGGAALWLIQPQWNLIAAFGFGVLGTAFFGYFGRDETAG